MKLYIDDARFDVLERVFDIYPVSGVTSNPSVLKNAGQPPVEQLKKLRAWLGEDKMLMSQIVSTKAEDMIEEARALKEIIADKAEQNYFVKLPANEQGIKAIKTLSAEGIRCNATAIYSVSQALMAAEAGAKTCAPYVNRIDNLGGDGLEVTRQVQNIIDQYGYDMTIVPGSIKSVKQVLACAQMGIYGVAIAAPVFDAFYANPTVDAAVDKFNSDFADLVGSGSTYTDLTK